ncbi:MAG: efflux transporter periplasmic adaptor subunit [Pelagibacterales bacterium MED-G40]|nr:MAG: efflux transporter periplasmic adaptor subunit [Pelagibacterales bacterium MED-G40]|tara:strand:- start:647 stop:1513 length:867 start_codon:yes stop_codon:yes gene_type:complete
MKKSKKVTIGILLFFIVVAVIIGGRSAIGNHFKKKFSKRPPPGVIVEVVKEKNFSQTIESYCTALSSQSVSFKIKKSELIEPINFGKKVKRGDIIAKLSSKNIIAPFSGKTGTRGISSSILGTNSIMLTLDDSKSILCDLQIPEVFAGVLKKGLRINAKFLAYEDKNYEGVIDSVASRIDAQTRSILARAKIKNKDLEILPGSLLDIQLFYNEKKALSVADTSIIFEDKKKFIYRILESNKIEKVEIVTGIRKDGNLEVLSGLEESDKIVKEGLTRLNKGMTVKPLIE